MLLRFFRFQQETSVICHNVNTQNVQSARRDRPHILASRRCETFELLHASIDIAPVYSGCQRLFMHSFRFRLSLKRRPAVLWVIPQVAQARNVSIGEHQHCCVTFKILGFVWEKTYRFCNLRK